MNFGQPRSAELLGGIHPQQLRQLQALWHHWTKNLGLTREAYQQLRHYYVSVLTNGRALRTQELTEADAAQAIRGLRALVQRAEARDNYAAGAAGRRGYPEQKQVRPTYMAGCMLWACAAGLGMQREDLDRFIRRHYAGVGLRGIEDLRTMADLNRVLWGLKGNSAPQSELAAAQPALHARSIASNVLGCTWIRKGNASMNGMYETPGIAQMVEREWTKWLLLTQHRAGEKKVILFPTITVSREKGSGGRSIGRLVRVVAPFEIRVQRLIASAGLERSTAESLITETDQQRAQFVQESFQQSESNPLLYDLIINTAGIAADTAAELITRAVEARFRDTPEAS